MASFREALSNIVLNLFLSSAHVAPPLKQKLINSLITFFNLLCGIFILRVQKSQVAIESASFQILRLLIVSKTGWSFLTGQNDLILEINVT